MFEPRLENGYNTVMKMKKQKKPNFQPRKPLYFFLMFLIVVFGIFLKSNVFRTVNVAPESLKHSEPVHKEVDKSVKEPVFPANADDLFREMYYRIASERDYFIREPEIKQKNTWWISEDGWSILVPTDLSIIAKVSPEQYYPNKNEFTILNSIVKDEMIKNGFTLNNLNSSGNEEDTKFYDYVLAYEKDDVKCVVTSSPDVGHGADDTKDYSEFSFSCFSNDLLNNAYEKQTPFLKGLQEKDAVVSHIKIQGNRAQMALNWRRTGAVAFMYKDGEDWRKVIVAQGIPSCSELEQNSVPQEYWVDCFQVDNQIRKGSFNF